MAATSTTAKKIFWWAGVVAAGAAALVVVLATLQHGLDHALTDPMYAVAFALVAIAALKAADAVR